LWGLVRAMQAQCTAGQRHRPWPLLTRAG
jgi:hypothetical protein